QRIQDALNDGAKFGANATRVFFFGGYLFIQNAEPELKKVERLEDPSTGPGDTLLAPHRAGVYKSSDHGQTWTYLGAATTPADLADVKKRFRNAQRIALAVSDPEGNNPDVFASAIVQDKFQGLFHFDTTADTVRFVMDSPKSVERNHNAVLSVEAT